MKKSLVALATLVATGAMAQVTISGLLDFANANISGTMPHQNGNTFSSNQGTAATSVIRIEAVEDLGGGMKATVHYGLDPRTLANDALANTLNPANTANTTTGLSRDQTFVGLSGGFGEIKLGSANSIGLTSYLASSVLGTGVGSGFGPGSAGTGALTYSNIRYNRSVRYDSPNMNGFSFALLYAPGNDEAATVTNGALFIPNARATTEVGLSYANGPLSLSAVSIKQDSMTNKTGYYSGAFSGADAGPRAATTNTSFNAKYVLGNTTIVASMNDGDALAVTTGAAAANPVPAIPAGAVRTTKGTRLGVSHAMGNVVLSAQLSEQETQNASLTADAKSKVTGMRADYNFSKTTTAYVGYENWDSGVAAAAGTAGTGERKITSIGLRKTF